MIEIVTDEETDAIRKVVERVTMNRRDSYMRYIDEFVALKCAPDLLALKVFPNAKEITESLAMFGHVRRWLGWEAIRDPSTQLVAVGDGKQPRTACMFAFRTRWHCWSVDPALSRPVMPSWAVSRLSVVPRKVENWTLPPCPRAVIACVHSHALLSDALRACAAAERIDLFSMSCCVPDDLPWPADRAKRSAGVLSPHNLTRAWLDLGREHPLRKEAA